MVASANHFSNLDFINSLNKYIPSLVLQRLIKKEQEHLQTNLPELQPMETVVVFADISGFTNLSEACAKKGDRGNEELAFCINRYMEGMVTNLNQYGGDIIKFVGDAMIVMWPPINKELGNWQETRNDTIRRAIQCAQDIQKTMNNLQILPGATLSVKIGIGYGPCSLLYVGGVFGRSESFTIGAALMLALRSEGQASSGGQIIVAEPAFKHVSQYFRAKELIDQESPSMDKFYLVDYKHQGQRVKIQADAMKLRSQFSSELLARVQPKMEGCVASSIIPFLQIDQERYGSENRSLTVMFVSLGVDLSSAETEKGMNHIQKIVTEVQKQVYRMQGSLNKLLMDDKGSTLICLWGLLPFAHDDDAARALLAGFNMIKALKKIDNTYCNIGVASGEVFSGVVGTSGSRKEFSVLGDVVNLSARIMGTIKGSGAKGEMRCDLNTRMLASNFFDFQYQQHYELKGKSISIPFYKPIDPQTKFDMARNKILSPENFLQVHQNPLNLGRNQEQGQKVRTMGFNDTLSSIVSEIAHYYSEDASQDWPLVTVIRGQIGSGKTAFARNLITDLHSVGEFAPYLRQNKEKLPIFTSTVNAETQLQFLSAWQPIIQQLLTFYCKRANVKKENFLAEVIAHQRIFDKVDLLCELTGVDKHDMLKKKGQQIASQVHNTMQCEPMPVQFPFVTRPDYLSEQKRELLEIITQLIKCTIGEEAELSGWNSFLVNKQQTSRDDYDYQRDDETAPIVIVIDNAHNMCPTSWDLLESVCEECYRICIILLVQSDDMDRIRVHSDSIKAFERVYNSISDNIGIIEKDLPHLEMESIAEIIRQNSNIYRSSFTNEMKGMTAILDPNKTIKTGEMGVEWRGILTKKWQLHTVMQSIDEEILRVIQSKCRGNPLLCLQYFVNMIHNGFVEVQTNGDVIPTEKFDFCESINDWSMVPVPRLILKVNTQMLDQYYFSIKMKQAQRPGELQGCASAIVLLKAAAVLGEEFEVKALKQISPFPKSANSQKRVEDSIGLLEQRDFIEIVDELDRNNCLCRFNKCFLRESTYQVLLYKSCKKDLHSATEKYIQTMPSLTTMKDNTLVTEQLLQHMKLAQDTEEESELLIERRSALVVLRVQNQINQNPRGLVLKDHLYKQGDAVNKSVEKRIVMLTQFDLKWFHNDPKELRDDYYMGCVKLPFIYDVVRSKQVRNERPSFMISVTMYYDRKKEEKSKRDIFFSCETAEERDRWIIAIDYLKTRAIFDAYAKKNTLVNFISAQKEDDAKRDEDAGERDHSDLLYEFGEQLKGRTSARANTTQQRANTSRMDSILMQRKSSVMRPIIERPDMTAADLVPKLKLLYKISMTAFLHHLDQNPKYFKTKAAIAKTVTGKQGQTQEPMQFPIQLDTWNYQYELEEAIQDDEDRKTIGSDQGRGSISIQSTHNYISPSLVRNGSGKDQYVHLAKQNSKNQRSDSRKNVSSSGSSDKGQEKGGSNAIGTRRSSSISADQVHASTTHRNKLPANPLIREEKDEDSSGESDNGLSKLSSSNKPSQSQKHSRFSQDVQNQQLSHPRKEFTGNNYRNSDDSSKGQSTPPVNNQLGLAQQRMSSQGLSGSDPTNEGRTEVSNSKEEQTSGFNVPLLSNIKRENRHTFASFTKEGHDSNRKVKVENTKRKSRDFGKHYGEAFQQTSSTAQPKHGEDPTAVYSGGMVGPQSSSNPKTSEGERSATFLEQQTFNRSQEQQDSQRHGNLNNASIGKDGGKNELSIIQHKYDSRMYQELVGNSILDPLMQPNRSQSKESLLETERAHQLMQQHDPQQQHQQAPQNPNKLMSSITSLIKQQLDQKMDHLFQEQQSKLDQIAAMQNQALQEQLNRQQHMLNSSFQQTAMLQQQQQQTQQSPSKYFSSNGLLQTPKQYQQLPHMRQHAPHNSAQINLIGVPGGQAGAQVQQPNMSLLQHDQPQLDLMTPERVNSQLGGPPYHLPPGAAPQNVPLFSQQSHSLYSQCGPRTPGIATINLTAISDHSQGGITSKRSHKYLFDSGQPILSKQDTEADIEEPADPMLETTPEDRYAVQNNRFKMAEQSRSPYSMKAQSQDLDRLQNSIVNVYDKRKSEQSYLKQSQQQQQYPGQGYHQQQQQQAYQHAKSGAISARPLPHALRSFHMQSEQPNLLPYGNDEQYALSEHETRTQQQQQQHSQGPHPHPHTMNQSFNQTQLYRNAPLAPQGNGYANKPYQNQSHTRRAQMGQPQQENDDYVSVATMKPSYAHGGGPTAPHYSEQHSQRAPHDQQHEQRLYFEQLQKIKKRLHHQPQHPMGFADTQLAFPPPEKWTETQYAIYEEPIAGDGVANSQDQFCGTPLSGSEQAFKAIAVRDTTELRMQQLVVPRGAPVLILEMITKHQVCKVNYKGIVGLFKLRDFVKDEKQKRPKASSESKPKSSLGAYSDHQNQSNRTNEDFQQQQQQQRQHQEPQNNNASRLKKEKNNISATSKRKTKVEQRKAQPQTQLTERDDLVSIEVSNAYGSRDFQHLQVSSNNLSGVLTNSQRQEHQNNSQAGTTTKRANVQNATIEQMSPINAVGEEGLDLSGTQRNFFREDPEKNFSKQLRSLTSQQLADASRRFLEEDRDNHKHNNLKLVERQKKKAQAARKVSATANPLSSARDSAQK